MSLLTFLDPRFIYSHVFFTPPLPTTSFRDRTVIVTGGNVGLGLETARHIARLGAAKVIISSRSAEKGEAAAASIVASEKVAASSVEVWALDLCSHESVRAFAARANALPRLDALICNAGVATYSFALSEGGHETTIETNVVGTFLLSLLLLPKLRETAARTNSHTHLEIVSSEVHSGSPFLERHEPPGTLFAALSDPHRADMAGRYRLSKLLEVFAVREMAALSPSPSVVMTAVNPGFCDSSLRREIYDRPGFLRTIVYAMEWVFARSSELGARIFVIAASAGPEFHGAYVSDGVVTPPARLVLSEEGKKLQRRVWEELRDVLEGIEPGVTKNL